MSQFGKNRQPLRPRSLNPLTGMIEEAVQDATAPLPPLQYGKNRQPIRPQAINPLTGMIEEGAVAAGVAEEERKTKQGLDEERKRQADRQSGTTMYGEEMAPTSEAHHDRNRTQADIDRERRLEQKPEESDKDYLDRMALEEGSELDQAVSEEKRWQADTEYQRRHEALLAYLGGDKSPNAQQGASEFVQQYPREYERILAERRGDSEVEHVPWDQDLMDEITSGKVDSDPAITQAGKDMLKFVIDSWSKKIGRDLGAEEQRLLTILQDGSFKAMSSQDRKNEMLSFAASVITPNEFTEYILDRMQSQIKSAEAEPERRRKMDEDRGQRLAEHRANRRRHLTEKAAQKEADKRGRFIEAMGRHKGNQKRLKGEIRRWNERNPNNPVSMQDFASATPVARPGDVVQVNDLSTYDWSRAAPGSIVSGPDGQWRVSMRGDKKIRGPVLQDSVTGMFFPDPDSYNTQQGFDSALSRQDRVNIRSSVLNSGNAVMANEQRRLDHARNAAAGSISEIRDAGMKEIAGKESDLHWRWITGQAQLQGIPTQSREEVEVTEGKAPKQPSERHVSERVTEIMGDRRSMGELGITRDTPPEQVRDIARDQVWREFLEEQTPISGGSSMGGGGMEITESITTDDWDSSRASFAQPQGAPAPGMPQQGMPQQGAPQQMPQQGAPQQMPPQQMPQQAPQWELGDDITEEFMEVWNMTQPVRSRISNERVDASDSRAVNERIQGIVQSAAIMADEIGKRPAELQPELIRQLFEMYVYEEMNSAGINDERTMNSIKAMEQGLLETVSGSVMR